MSHQFFRFFPVFLFVVSGNSMLPQFVLGDLVIALRFLSLKPGDVVIACDPRDSKLLVKRIQSIENGKVFLRGDNSAQSTDSRTFGMVSKTSIVAKVIAKL